MGAIVDLGQMLEVQMGVDLGGGQIGMAEQFGSVYFPTYAVVLTFLIMVVVLAFRPYGLLGRA